MTSQTPEGRTVTRTVQGHEVPIAGTWNLDPTHTSITFEVRHMMISKVRGSIQEASGTIEIGDAFADSRVEVTMETASVETGTPDRDTHLRSPDFFDVATYPHMSFRSTSIETTEDGFRINGELTVKDVTAPVILDAEFNGGIIDPYGNPRVAFSAAGEVDRTDWGLTWNMALETGGVLVGKKAKLIIDTEATLAN